MRMLPRPWVTWFEAMRLLGPRTAHFLLVDQCLVAISLRHRGGARDHATRPKRKVRLTEGAELSTVTGWEQSKDHNAACQPHFQLLPTLSCRFGLADL